MATIHNHGIQTAFKSQKEAFIEHLSSRLYMHLAIVYPSTLAVLSKHPSQAPEQSIIQAPEQSIIQALEQSIIQVPEQSIIQAP